MGEIKIKISLKKNPLFPLCSNCSYDVERISDDIEHLRHRQQLVIKLIDSSQRVDTPLSPFQLSTHLDANRLHFFGYSSRKS